MVNRVVLGNKTGDEFGLYVSKPGVDALTETDLQKFLVHPDIRPNDIMFHGTLDLRGQTIHTYNWSVTHDLGYIPVVYIRPYIDSTAPPVGVAGNVNFGFSVTTTTVSFWKQYINGATMADLFIAYYIFRYPLILPGDMH